MEEGYLITGLGNPGKAYEDTRHNIGFRIVKALAAKYGLTFRPSLIRAKGSICEGKIQDKQVLLLLPLTFMNESGLAVRKCMDYFKFTLQHSMTVADDIALPFGEVRIRDKGSCGGHNGLRSIEAHLNTQEYPRMRIGVDDKRQGSLADYVLDTFTQEEQRKLPDIVDVAIHALEIWLTSGVEEAKKVKKVL